MKRNFFFELVKDLGEEATAYLRDEIYPELKNARYEMHGSPFDPRKSIRVENRSGDLSIDIFIEGFKATRLFVHRKGETIYTWPK
jgi:hypothetical protein